MKNFAFLDWFFQRNLAISFIFFLGCIFFLNKSILISLILIFVSFHLKVGFETLINDYIHSKAFKLFSLNMLQLILVILLKSVFLFIIL